jgi:hypothetical protein
MKKLFFTFSAFILLLGTFQLVQAQSVSSRERQLIERELERSISSDTGENVTVRIRTAESYSFSNRENGVRGQATVQGRRSSQREIYYDVVIDTRRNRISTVNWNEGSYRNYDQNPPSASGPLSNGIYEIQLVATKRMLAAGNNGQVVQTNASNTREQQWEIEDAGNGFYYVRLANTGEIMTYEGDGRNGSTVVLRNQRNQQDEQLWEIRTGPDNGYYFIARNGKSLDSPSSARYDGGRMQLYNRNGEANQRFWLRRVSDWNNYQYDNRRDRRRDRSIDRYDQRGGYGWGSLTWRGRVDGEIELEIQGNQVYERVISGKPISSVRRNFTASLPRRDVNVEVQLIEGRGNVEVIQQPSSRNNYQAIVLIRDSQGGADDYEIEIRWN